MATIKTVRKSLRVAHGDLKSWRKVGAKFGITGAMAFRIAKRNYEPKTHKIRHTLDIPAMVEVPPCQKCGEIHMPKYCRSSRNGAEPARKRTPPIRIGEATDEELEAIKSYLTTDERREALVEAANKKRRM